MNEQRRYSLRDEQGQSLVFVVLSLFVLVLMMALVIDVGSWLRAHRQLQTVADAAALASVQALPFDPFAAQLKADEYAKDNWPGIAAVPTISPTNPSEITVTVERVLPGFFGSLSGIDNITATARATALVQAPTTLNNSDFSAITVSPAYVAPLVININRACQVASCFGSPTSLIFDESIPSPTSEFGFANISCDGRSCRAPMDDEFRQWITCSPCVPGPIVSGSSFMSFSPDPTAVVSWQSAMNSIVGKTLILPVFGTVGASSYQVLGFSAFAVTGVDWADPIKTISGSFVKYNAPGAVSASPPSTIHNFGVQVIGLTS